MVPLYLYYLIDTRKQTILGGHDQHPQDTDEETDREVKKTTTLSKVT